MTTEALLIYLMVGCAAGFLAGLLGVGGGLIIVPALIWAFGLLHFAPDHLMHLALGTSLASIIFTSISSVRAHHARGAVKWQVVRRMGGGLVLGTFLGAGLASQLPSTGLKWFFCIFAYLVAAQMLANFRPKPSRTLPQTGGLLGVGGVIGAISSFVGIGGGSLSVPFLAWCNVPLPNAIATSAALGFPIAVGGLAGYLAHGWHSQGLPPGALGFVYLPALAGIVFASMLTAPLGATLAHRLPVATLKKCFALLLIVVASKMIWNLLAH
ncbi:sulfite exporter TauE/SafE family protein [Parachitinimonas caeni]|nr:sulfite exporter TauE/SafE family protein [Parachitinimonas caeni]